MCLCRANHLMASANFSMSAQIEESGVSVTPGNALASSDYALSSIQRGDSTVNYYPCYLNGGDYNAEFSS